MRRDIPVLLLIFIFSGLLYADSSQELFLAVRRGNLLDVRQAIGDGANVNTSDTFGYTPLMFSVETRNADIITYLLDMRADPNIQEKINGQTALMLAVKRGGIDTARILIQNGARLDIRDRNGNTALIWAACANVEIIQLLISNGAEINARNRMGRTVLSTASGYRCQETASLITALGGIQ